ncbi:HAD family hydrolase, partial [Acinetobacter baumannii]|uniref:HAD family hydrolase n=1 Tax=Acinetobacter baumannii TaxID=470 RepID=UPI000A43C03F
LNTVSDHAWGEFLDNEGLVDPVHHRQMNDKVYEDYKAGQLDPQADNEFVFGFLKKHENNYLTELHQWFMEKVILPQMRPKGFDEIKKHQDLAHTIVGITATSDFITAPIFREFGITEILATNAAVADGKYTGKV